MEVESYKLARGKAAEELLNLRAAFKQNLALKKEHALVDMQRVYGYMSHHGGTVIDVPASIAKAGLNAEGDPKLAIIRADFTRCNLYKRDEGGCLFSGFINKVFSRPLKKDGDFALPRGTFTWKRREGTHWIERQAITTPTPIIPPAILIDEVMRSLKNYYILWEVEKWDEVPRDPILLKRLTPNLFGVLATWNLSELERAIIRGRL